MVIQEKRLPINIEPLVQEVRLTNNLRLIYNAAVRITNTRINKGESYWVGQALLPDGSILHIRPDYSQGEDTTIWGHLNLGSSPSGPSQRREGNKFFLTITRRGNDVTYWQLVNYLWNIPPPENRLMAEEVASKETFSRMLFRNQEEIVNAVEWLRNLLEKKEKEEPWEATPLPPIFRFQDSAGPS